MDALQGLRAAITELQTEAHRQRDEILLLRSIKPKPKSSLPDPEKFSGQPHKFDTWLPSIKAKLRVDGEAIGDSVAQFYYVYLNLESHIQAMVLPQLHQAEESQVWNYITILDQLIRVYDNPNKAPTLSRHTLLSLRESYMRRADRIGQMSTKSPPSGMALTQPSAAASPNSLTSHANTLILFGLYNNWLVGRLKHPPLVTAMA